MTNPFQEPQDSPINKLIQILLLLGLFGVLLWFLMSLPTDSTLWLVSLIDMLLLIPAFFSAVISLAVPKEKAVRVIGAGSATAAAFAVFLAYFLFFAIIAGPALITGKPLSIYESLSWLYDYNLYDFLNYVFTCYVQPFAEEILRWWMVPTVAALIYGISKKRINMMIAAGISIFLIVNPFFAFLHFFTDITSLTNSGIPSDQVPGELAGRFMVRYTYGVIWSVGNYVTGSALFSIVYHKLHNTYVYLATQGFPDVPLWLIPFDIGFYVLTFLIMAVGLYNLARHDKK
jgi:hypothetical protein